MLKSVYDNDPVTLKTVYKWYGPFKSENEQRLAYPLTVKRDENVQKA